MKSLYSIYKIVLSIAKKRNITDYGICHNISIAKGNDRITSKEEEKVIKHFKSCRPTFNRFADFREHPSYHWLDDKPFGAYWWETDREGYNQRLLFLQALIEDTKPWYIKLWDKIWWI